MAGEQDILRDWHRLFGLLLTDFFTGSPFAVEIESDLSLQQQFLDVVIVRRGRGQMTLRLPDGLETLAEHNLITFKSHHETLDSWAIKELIGHAVAYRKLVSPSPASLLPEDKFRLFAVSARFPDKLAGQVPWQERQAGVYDCSWGTDVVRVVVARQLSREAQNAPLHLFSAAPELVGFGQSAYQRRSENTSLLLIQLFESFRGEHLMSYTMEDFKRDVMKKYFEKLTPKKRREMMVALPPEERREMLAALPPEERLAGLPPEERLAGLPPEQRLAGLSTEQIREYLDHLNSGQTSTPRKQRRKK